MRSKETKVFVIQEKEIRFNREAFNQAILIYSRNHRMKIGKVEESLADIISVNIETIRNWRKGSNGPGSDTYIKEAAKFLGVSDWTSLFTETDGGNNMNQLNEKQIDAVKKVYDACVEALNHFIYLENVRSLLRFYKLRKAADAELSADDICYEITNRMFLVIDQEYFYLRNHGIYNDLANFTVDVSNDVVTTLHNYLEDPEHLEVLFDKYSTFAANAMAELNGIINDYIPEGE